jgi:mercuric ion transport protein
MMWRDRWFVLGLIGAAFSCLACLTPVVVLALGALGRGAWKGHLDLVLFPLLVGLGLLAVYRYRSVRRRTP